MTEKYLHVLKDRGSTKMMGGLASPGQANSKNILYFSRFT